MTLKYYVGDKITGLSSDTKPTTVNAGATFFETDTGKTYVYDGSTWNTYSAASGVSSFNGRTGAVSPQSGDYTASMVGLGNVPNVDTTNPLNITQDSTHRFASDTEKSTWNGKQDALGYTPENVSNKKTTLTDNSDTYYPTQKSVKSYVDGQVYSSGCVTVPTLTNNGDGTATLGSFTASLYNNSTFSDHPQVYSISGNTFTLTDNTTNYIYATYNSGTPILGITTDVSLITVSDVIPVYTIIRTGLEFHTLDWDELSKGLADKLFLRLVKTERFTRESGLAISESGTRNIDVTSGIVWYGATRKNLGVVNSLNDNIDLYYHSGGSWTKSSVTQYDNTQYDNGTDLVELTPNRYAVNWVFRGVETDDKIYIILGSGDYTSAQASSAVVPVPPNILTAQCILIGKIVVQKGDSTATSIQSAFETQFSAATATIHNDLSALQGDGTSNEYYHLTNAQLQIVKNSKSFAIAMGVAL